MNILKVVIYSLIVFILIYLLFPLLLSFFNLKSVFLISGSMSHKKINQTVFEEFYDIDELPFRYGLEAGDVILIKTKNEYKVGDVVAFKRSSNMPTIHRIYNTSSNQIITIGDKLVTSDIQNPTYLTNKSDFVSKESVIGAALLKIPLIGLPHVIITCSSGAYSYC